MTWLRSMMFLCSLSLRRSRKRYFSRSSSGVVSFSDMTGIGSGSAIDCTTISAASSSTCAGGEPGFTVAASRATTLPLTVITLSLRTASAVLKTGLETSTTHLGHAIVVAQVDEQQVAVVALALDPARQAGLLADMLGPQLAARMGSVDGRHHGFSGLVTGRQKARIDRPSQANWAFRLRQLCRGRPGPL